MEKTQVSDDELRLLMLDLLDQGERGCTNFYEILRTKIKIERSRCIKMYAVVEQEYIKLKDDVIHEQRVASFMEAAKNGLKSDLELEIILCQYACQNVDVEEWIDGKMVLRGISPSESISAIAQLFKKRGSYAPVKVNNNISGSIEASCTISILPKGECKPLSSNENDVEAND